MRNRLTKQAMGLNDSPTTMHVEQKNPDISKYETGDPSAWGEDVNEDSPWDLENSKGREETGHPKKVRESHTYASMVKEAKELENKALHCLKMAEVLLGEDAPADVIERQAVDFMTMSNKSVLSSLRRMREFEEQISETRVAKIVDAVLEVIAEEEEEEKKAEEKEEEKMAEKKATQEDEDTKIAAIVEAVLAVMAEEKEEEKKAEKEEEKKEAAKEEEKMAEKEEEKKAEKEEEKKEASEESSSVNVSFDEGADVIASEEDVALLAQLFSSREASEDSDKKDAKIKTLKNVTASADSGDEISKLASLWSKDF